ncbi:DUF3047 domain-containing protein [Thioalkalivibrio sp.]|uniref:DUF3047 domain-containing protein n=1 Tax=Thioalkalivibrio sp. TaxID=2093813 RepID=UPI003974BF56
MKTVACRRSEERPPDHPHGATGTRARRAARTRRWSLATAVAGLLSLAGSGAMGAPAFAPADIISWAPHAFAGTTEYRLVEIDGRQAVQANCTDGTASGLFYRQDIDLTQTPIVEWEWRVDETLTGIDETTRAGDDYPARLYLVDEAPVLRWRTRALNYIWSSTSETGSDWPNAFAAQAQMIAVAGAKHAGRGWRTERRNVLEDFRRHHEREPDRINALAVMTDCDNTGQQTRAWYGNIRFLPE